MKELEKHNRESEKQQIEAVEEKKQKQEIKFDSTIMPYKGHKLFEINIVTKKIKEAEYNQKEPINILTWDKECKKEVLKKKDCVYISALNKESALKRLKQMKGSAARELKNENINELV